MRALSELREIVRDYGTHRNLLWQFVLRDVRVRYKQAVMGILWALLMPALLVLAGLLIRATLSSPASAGDTQVGAIAVRGVLWASFSAAVSFGTASLVGNSHLVGKVAFAREVLPVAAVIANMFDGAIAMTVVALALPWLGGMLSPALLWVPVLFALLFVLTIAAALALSFANAFFRDVKYIVQALLSVGLLFTPVLYSPAELGPTGARLIAFNPLTAILEGTRLAVFEGHNLLTPLVIDGVVAWSPGMLAYTATIAVVGLVLASLAFHRAEDLFAERI